MLKAFFRDLKGGLGPAVVIALLLFAAKTIIGIPEEEVRKFIDLVSRSLSLTLPRAVVTALTLVLGVGAIAKIIWFIGVLKRKGWLIKLLGWLPADNFVGASLRHVFGGKEQSFRYVLALSGPYEHGLVYGLAMNKHVSWIDGRSKYTVFISSALNPLSGLGPLSADASRLITAEDARRLIADPEGSFTCAEDIARAGYFIIVSDLREEKPRYPLSSLITFLVSCGRYAPPGDVIEEDL